MNPVLQQLLTVDSGIGLCWLGNLGWLRRVDGKLIANDLGLDRSSRLFPSSIPTAELAPHLDLHFITHEHRDHFSGPTSEILASHGSCQFVLPANCAGRAAEFKIPEDRITVAVPDSRPHGEPTLAPVTL